MSTLGPAPISATPVAPPESADDPAARWETDGGHLAPGLSAASPTDQQTFVHPTTAPADDAGTACDVCAHELASHDALGLRFCRATRDSSLPRGCICRW